ncbi:MAG: hypothetical protein ACR2QV_04330 [Gammaproteobacteria bacterium]
MKCIKMILERCLVLALAMCLVAFIPAAHAVLKDLSIVDGEGNSLANTKVTIVFPDGTEVDEETDDDGMLYFDFPDEGEYTVRYPGGQMAVNVGGGGGGMSTGKWLGAGAAAAVLVGVGIAASDSGSSGDSGSPSSSSPSSDPGSSGSSGSGGSSPPSFDVSVCNPAVYSVTATLSGDDPGGHAQADSFNGNWEVSCPGGSGSTQVDIRSQSGSGPDPAWTCTVGTGGDCMAFDAPCVWGGMSTACSIEANFTSASPGMNGIFIIGQDGSLPPGQPVFFDMVGTRQ